uniref:Calmodulin like 6 n=1 Tax=Salmo trutta TaxID=8032 RepID=A0A674ESS8_SALTR
MANALLQEQITEYKGAFEMFDEEGNGTVKIQGLERLMSLMGINPTKRDLLQTAEDVDKDGKGTFNRESFLGLMAFVHESARGQHAVLRAAFKAFEKEPNNTYSNYEPQNELEAEQMTEADKDGDGSFDYEEFVTMMTGGSFKMS